MIELLYALRLLSGQIAAEDVPDVLRETAVRWAEELAERTCGNEH